MSRTSATMDSFARARLIEGDQPAVRYATGTTLCQESLVDSRWVGRTWSPTGIVDVDMSIRGDLRWSSAFELEIDGASLHRGWTWLGYEEVPSERPGEVHACVHLRHAVRPVEVRVHTTLDGSALLTRWLEITNAGTAPAALASMSVWSGKVFPLQNDQPTVSHGHGSAHGTYSVGYFVDDAWGHEGNFQWVPLGREGVSIGQDNGKSGWGHPIAFLRDEGAGHVFVAQLAWSGNWTMRARDRGGLVFLEVGPSASAPMRVIDPGETIRTPAVHLGCVAGDLTAMVRQIHTHQRRSATLSPPGVGANLVTYNHWSYLTHEMTEDVLRREIDLAAEIGAELFIIDAGWYGDPGQSWGIVPGYWRPGGRLPRGFAPIFEHARARGLKVGIWLWIEAASKDGQLIGEHQEWLIERDGHRLDNMLDLAKPEVAAHVEAEAMRVVEEYGLDLFRLDYNASPGEGGYNRRGEHEENTLWRHYEAMYAIWEKLHARYPHLLMENCAGGGGRTDLGHLSRFHHVQSSDYWLMPRAVRIHNGLMLALAPELLNRMYGVVMNAHIGGSLETGLHANVLCGVPGFSGLWPQPEDRQPIVLEKTTRAIAFYKEHVRPMIRTCAVHHHDPVLPGWPNPEGWCVMEFAADDATKSIVGAFRLAGDADTERVVKPRGISRAGTYRVTQYETGEACEVSGRELVDTGVTVRLPSAVSSELLLIEKVE